MIRRIKIWNKMDDFIKLVVKIKDKAEQYQENIKEKTRKNEDLSPGCFGMIYNSSILVLELLSHYKGAWSGRVPDDWSDERVKESLKAKGQRCVMISKMLFIESFSAIEFTMKNLVDFYPQSDLSKWKQEEKNKLPFISFFNFIFKYPEYVGQDSDKWKFLIELRNCTIHNNNIADKDLEVIIGGRKFEMEKGRMMNDKLDFFFVLTLVLMDLYYFWINQFIDKNGGAEETAQ